MICTTPGQRWEVNKPIAETPRQPSADEMRQQLRLECALNPRPTDCDACGLATDERLVRSVFPFMMDASICLSLRRMSQTLCSTSKIQSENGNEQEVESSTEGETDGKM